MNILLSIFFSPRPRGVIDMPATVSKWLCRKGYTAITLFGRIYTREQVEADKLNSTLGALKNHEMIHLRQAQNTYNSWLVFYFLYMWHSMLALRYFRKTRNAAYYLNPFEIEAYVHMYDLHYLERFGKKGADGWRAFAGMSLAARLRFIRQNGIG